MTRFKSLFKATLVFSLPVVLVPLASTSGRPQVAAAARTGQEGVAILKPIVPPHNPANSVAPDPNFLGNSNCADSNDRLKCNTAILSAVTHARKVQEAIGGMHFSVAKYLKLSKIAQLFATVNIERIERGLPAITMLTKSLDSVAQIGAVKNEDPPLNLVPLTLPGGGHSVAFGSNWATGQRNPLGSDYGWMYDDGYNSPNYGCTKAHPAACWGHRDNILGTWVTKSVCSSWGTSTFETVMGAGYVGHGAAGGDGETELFVGVCGPAPTDHILRWSWLKGYLSAK